MVKRVNMKEFVKHTSKYLKGEPVIITKYSEDFLEVGPIRSGRVRKVVQGVNGNTLGVEYKDVELYGCGCVKDPYLKMCKRHGRV